LPVLALALGCFEGVVRRFLIYNEAVVVAHIEVVFSDGMLAHPLREGLSHWREVLLAVFSGVAGYDMFLARIVLDDLQVEPLCQFSRRERPLGVEP
jgi:hypothetical protein